MHIHANGIDIHYRITGSGPWVTLSHSLACDLTMWDEQAEVLSGRHTVLRFDSRGHGKSGAPPGPYGLEQMADDVIGLLDALGVARTHFVGLSMGGMIGQHVALQAPQRVARLVLADTSSRLPPEVLPVWQERIRIVSEHGMEARSSRRWQRWFTAPFRASHPHVMARIGALIRATPVAGFIGCCHAVPQIDVAARLRGLTLPTLILVGDQDGGTPPSMAQEMHAAIAGSEFELIAGASHLSNIEQADRFNALLLDFLGRQP